MANLRRRQQRDVLGTARKVADILVRREPDSRASPQHQISRKTRPAGAALMRADGRTDMTKLMGAFMRLRERAEKSLWTIIRPLCRYCDWKWLICMTRECRACLLTDCTSAVPAAFISPVVLYGCETWSLTLREERSLRVFENMVLRRIFGPRRDEVTGGLEETA